MSPRPLGQRSLCLQCCSAERSYNVGISGGLSNCSWRKVTHILPSFLQKYVRAGNCQLSVIETHGKIFFFYLQQQNRAHSRECWPSFQRGECLSQHCALYSRSWEALESPPNVELVSCPSALATFLYTRQETSVCPFLLVCFSWLFLTRTGNRSSFPCMV